MPMEVINAGRQLVEDLFPDEIAQFADAECDAWDALSNLSIFPANSDVGCTLDTKLRQMIPVCSETFQKVLISMYCLAPHSMQTERVVSYYSTNYSDKRLPTNSLTVNHNSKSPLMEREQRILILDLALLSFSTRKRGAIEGRMKICTSNANLLKNSFVLNHVYNYNCFLTVSATITVVHLLHYILSY